MPYTCKKVEIVPDLLVSTMVILSKKKDKFYFIENTQNINILMFSMPEEQILFNKAVGAFLFNWVYS